VPALAVLTVLYCTVLYCRYGVLTSRQGVAALEGFLAALHAGAGAAARPLAVVAGSPFLLEALRTHRPGLRAFTADFGDDDARPAGLALKP